MLNCSVNTVCVVQRETVFIPNCIFHFQVFLYILDTDINDMLLSPNKLNLRNNHSWQFSDRSGKRTFLLEDIILYVPGLTLANYNLTKQYCCAHSGSELQQCLASNQTNST